MPASSHDDPALRDHFGVQPGDDATTATSVNGNPGATGYGEAITAPVMPVPPAPRSA